MSDELVIMRAVGEVFDDCKRIQTWPHNESMEVLMTFYIRKEKDSLFYHYQETKKTVVDIQRLFKLRKFFSSYDREAELPDTHHMFH